jgi:hypothetical protein
MLMTSKYPESAEDKISIGPVYALNPRYVKSIVIVAAGGPEQSWLDVRTVGNMSLTSELEHLDWCKETALAFQSRNPAIVVWINEDGKASVL